MATYKLQKHPSYDQPMAVFHVESNMSIPFDPANTDYQAYLKWLEEGNQPEPAEQA